MFRTDTRQSESFHTFLIMGEFSDLIGRQGEIWPVMQLIQSQSIAMVDLSRKLLRILSAEWLV